MEANAANVWVSCGCHVSGFRCFVGYFAFWLLSVLTWSLMKIVTKIVVEFIDAFYEFYKLQKERRK